MHLSSGRHNSPRRGRKNTFFVREGARRKPFFCPQRGAEDILDPFVHGGPRRGTENILDPSCPRRGRENRAIASKFGRHNSPRRGRKNTFFVREGARRKPFFVHGGARRGTENRAIASKFGRHNSPRRAPTRGAPTDFREPQVGLSQFDAIALGAGFSGWQRIFRIGGDGDGSGCVGISLSVEGGDCLNQPARRAAGSSGERGWAPRAMRWALWGEGRV